MDIPTAPSRLMLDGDALVANWRWLAIQSGSAACGAAVKADGYGTDAAGVVARLKAAGCRDFFVATWAEAAAIADAAAGVNLSVLHGVRAEDIGLARAMAGAARPTLCTADQIRRWREAGGGNCDVMVDTGMNRLGVSAQDVTDGLLDGLAIDTLMSHLASADEDVPQNAQQRTDFAALRGKTSARRMSLANSAGICLGAAYAFDLTRPGLALYGGVPRREAHGHIRQVVRPEAQVLQRRTLKAGNVIGYNATFRAPRDLDVAIINLGYADGILRAFSDKGSAGDGMPMIGRVSMDLIAIDVSRAPTTREGDWLAIDYDLAATSAATGLSPYELLTNLGQRWERRWG